MDIAETARESAPMTPRADVGAIVHVSIVEARDPGAALGKEFVATDNDAPFTSETAAQEAIDYGLRQADGTFANPWRQLRGPECEFRHSTRHTAAVVPVADLYALEGLLAALQTAPHRDLAIARGGLKSIIDNGCCVLATAMSLGGDLQIFPGHAITARQHENFEDAPSRLLLLDLDGLKLPDLDVSTADSGDIDDVLRGIVDGIPTLAGASFVFQPTSSFGLIDRHKLAGRLAFIADRAITLEEEQVLTDHLNREAGRALFDTSICATGHLVYTSLPALYADIAARGRVRLGFDAAHRDRLLARVVEGERDSIAVPALDADLLQTARAVRAAAARRSSSEWTKGWSGRNVRPLVWARDIAPLLAEISSCGAYTQVFRAVMQLALRAPSFKFQSLLKRLSAEARARIMETATGGDLKRRLAYADLDRLESALDTALTKAGRRKQRVALPRQEAPISLQEGRDFVLRALDESVNAHGTALDEWRRACARAIKAGRAAPRRPEIPTVVIRAPAGVGKTHNTNEIQDNHRARSSHILHLTPTIELAKQKERDYQARWGTQDSRRIKSRAELCVDPGDWGRRCEKLERFGQSPKPVCELCPHKDSCPAPSRDRDFTHGLTIGTHPQAGVLFGDQWLGRDEIHNKRKQQPEHTFWDETVVPALLGEPRRCDMDSAALDTEARREIAAAVRASKAEVATAIVAGRGVVGWCWAAHAEQERREAAERTIATAVAAISGRKPKRGDKAAKDKRAADEAKLAAAQDDFEQAAFFELASRAIYRALLSGREFVFGLDAAGSEGLAQLPKQLPEMIRQGGTYVLDATSVPVLDRALLGPDTIVRTVPPVLPGAVHVAQFCDRAYGQSFFPEAARADSAIARLHAFIRHEAALLLAEQRQHGCAIEGHKIDVAVMCQPAVRRQLIERGLPGNVHVTTHKLARGLNFAEEAPCVITVGRTMPSSGELLRQARVVAAGLAPDENDLLLTLDTSSFEPATLPCADGPGVELRRRRYLHPLVQALAEYYESDVVQSAFRGRPLSRRPDNPLRLVVFGNVATGLPIHEPLDWSDAARSELDIQQALGVVRERAEKIALRRRSPYKRSNARTYVDYAAGDVISADAPAAVASADRRWAEKEVKAAWAEHLAETAHDPRWRTGSCLVAGHRYRQRVSIDTGRHADPQAAVQLAFGPVAVWKGWEGAPAPKRPRGRPRKAVHRDTTELDERQLWGTVA